MLLQCDGLTKDYGNGKGLQGFTMDFTPGIYGILGPNGSGKSTLMNLLTDNTRRTAGRILLDGQEVLRLGSRYRARLGYMPQHNGLYPQLSPMAFLRYMARLKGLRGKQITRTCLELLEAVNLTQVRYAPMGSFSGGMCQRVLLAQALLGQPDILLLDEPTAGLDPRERIRIRNLISSLSANRIILIATHIVSDIELIADQVLIMKQGRLEQFGTPEALEQLVADHVREYPQSQLPHTDSAGYRVGNLYRKQSQTWLRLIGDSLPAGGTAADRLDLEDVYLYYLEA